ncbi:MAG TPA: 4Fe-4S dicluster domain-containing protein, partial [Armatimonadota bacterium]|nr:4Fe-4S dicluster domain-containing protein [Armatimonadota bacterium]
MSQASAFERQEYPAGEATVHTFQHHESYGLPPEGRARDHESELTSGFTILPDRQYGFLTDTSICIGCKACEVACKEWNQLPADDVEWLGTSYDNTHTLNHRTWRHVSFVEQPPANGGPPRWLFQSDICKHCDHAGCLEACPTGAIVRTEYGSVVIQQDICNGCQYCVPSCPFGV